MRSSARVRSMLAALVLVLAVPAAARAADLCAKQKPGTISFYDREISRDDPLPAPVTKLDFSKPMFALLCLADAVGPQDEGGEKFRIVLFVKQVNLKDDQYSSYKKAKQAGAVFRPELSKSRKDIIVSLGEGFGDSLGRKLDAGDYEFRVQAATEKGTGKVDVTIDFKNDVAYLQELRKAGYVADGTVQVAKSE
jgi:hypothetical protein